MHIYNEKGQEKKKKDGIELSRQNSQNLSSYVFKNTILRFSMFCQTVSIDWIIQVGKDLKGKRNLQRSLPQHPDQSRTISKVIAGCLGPCPVGYLKNA